MPIRKFKPGEGHIDRDAEDNDSVREQTSKAGDLARALILCNDVLDEGIDFRALDATDAFWDGWRASQPQRDMMLQQADLVNRIAGETVVRRIVQQMKGELMTKIGDRAGALAQKAVATFEAAEKGIAGDEYRARLPGALRTERTLPVILSDSKAAEEFSQMSVSKLFNAYEKALQFDDVRVQELIESSQVARLREFLTSTARKIMRADPVPEFTATGGSTVVARSPNEADIDKDKARASALLREFEVRREMRIPETIKAARQIFDYGLVPLFSRIYGLDVRPHGPMSSEQFSRFFLQGGGWPAKFATDPVWPVRYIRGTKIQTSGWSKATRTVNGRVVEREPALSYGGR